MVRPELGAKRRDELAASAVEFRCRISPLFGTMPLMIALDEEMVGSDPNCILVPGLKVCLGLFIARTNDTLLAAHFSPGVKLLGMNLILAHLRAQAAGAVKWMGMVSKLNYWSEAPSGFTSKELLAAYFRVQMRYAGPMNYADLQWAPASYDIRFTPGVTPRLEYRATPNPNPTTITPLAHVLKLTHYGTQLTPTSGVHPNAMHAVPNNTAGFAMLSDDIKQVN